eukprot:SAG31_NODE_11413_length_1033_cov_1.255889_2_plen_175_part_00
MDCAVKIFSLPGNGSERDQDESVLAVKAQNERLELKKSFFTEYTLLKELNHENLVNYYGACTQPPPKGQLAIVMELMAGSLAELLHGKWQYKSGGVEFEMTDKRLLVLISLSLSLSLAPCSITTATPSLMPQHEQVDDCVFGCACRLSEGVSQVAWAFCIRTESAIATSNRTMC